MESSSDSGRVVLVADDSTLAALSCEDVAAIERVVIISTRGSGSFEVVDAFPDITLLSVEPCCASYDYYWDHEEANLPCSPQPLPGVSRPWRYLGKVPKRVDKDHVGQGPCIGETLNI